MASFGMLPNELLGSVVEHLQDRKIDDFDIVATQDLQNLRLTCIAVCGPSYLTTLHYTR